MTFVHPVRNQLGHLAPEAQRCPAAEALLFDFDGAICSVSAGYAASKAAEQLRLDLTALRPEVVWTSAGRSDDPLRVVLDVPAWGSEFTVAPDDDRLTELETLAVATAAPSHGGATSMWACRESGRHLAVVSNNSTRAVQSYLSQHGPADLLDGHIWDDVMAGRS